MKFILIMFTICNVFAFAQNIDPQIKMNKWKGFSILGNGKVCVVYSDDHRVAVDSGQSGIQHFYFNDYTADYIHSTKFEIFDQSGSLVGSQKNEILLGEFFEAKTLTTLKNYDEKTVTCFVHPDDAAILKMDFNGENSLMKQKFTLNFRKKLVTDKVVQLQNMREEKGIVITKWSNRNFIAVASRNPQDRIFARDSVVEISSRIGNKDNVEIIIAASSSFREVITKIENLRRERDLYASAKNYWNAWMNRGVVPNFTHQKEDSALFTEFYKRNLYCVKSANLHGQIPADITGQFVTNNMPQLYPRDAMMSARVFMLTGHYDEAKQVIRFWKNSRIPMKSKGEWFARYDANAKAVDAGTGARFDEPEWDANGYFIQLVYDYYKKKNKWLADKEYIYTLADFLINNIDENGLLYEGGIVEWTGYLPATNMTCAAALKTASEIAVIFGDNKNQQKYLKASEKISSSLNFMFDKIRKTYADVRFIGKKGIDNQSITNPTKDTLYLWDTSMNFGLLWGYENHKEVEQSNLFYIYNTFKNEGGVQYFDSPDPGLASYGHDMFFFTTAASAQYHSIYGSRKVARENIEWMIRNSNIYGLMPERIYQNLSDCSPASPLSWCSAEFAAALLQYNKFTKE